MIRGRCPICSRSFTVAALADLPSFPFCSDRCRLVDLGRWIDGAYAVPGPEMPDSSEELPTGEDDEDEG